MNFKNFVVTVMVIVGLFVVSNPVFAQMPKEEYIVQPGDNLWELAGDKLGDPRVWEQLVDANPFLKEPGRRFERGDKIVVLLRPGESLKGLEDILRPMDITWDPVPFSALRAAAPSAALKEYYKSEPPHQPWWTYTTFSVDDVVWSALGLLLLLVVALALASFARVVYLGVRRERALRDNPHHPEYQGAPMRTDLRAVLGIPAPVSEHVRVIERLAGDVRGTLTEIVEVNVGGQDYGNRVMTEYRDGNRVAVPTGQALYLGVYRENGAVTRVTGHWRACLNGLLFDQMSQVDLLHFVQTARWSNPHRIWHAAGFNPPFNFEPIKWWLEQSATDEMFGRRERTEAPPATVIPTSATPVTPPSPLIPEVSIDATGTIFQIGGQRFVLPASLPVQIQDGNIRIGTPHQVAPTSAVPPTTEPDGEHPSIPGNGAGARMYVSSVP